MCNLKKKKCAIFKNSNAFALHCGGIATEILTFEIPVVATLSKPGVKLVNHHLVSGKNNCECEANQLCIEKNKTDAFFLFLFFVFFHPFLSVDSINSVKKGGDDYFWILNLLFSTTYL